MKFPGSRILVANNTNDMFKGWTIGIDGMDSKSYSMVYFYDPA